MRRAVASLAAILILLSSAYAAEPLLADVVERQDRAVICKLLDQHVDVNAAQPDGTAALHWAVHHDDIELTRMLLASGANAKATNRYGVAALMLACVNGNGRIVDLLLTAGADPNASLRGGETPLMTAARTGVPGPVASLVRAGAQVDAKERRGQTALMWAAAEGHTDVVERLIHAGANVQQTVPESGFTPLFFAVRSGRDSTVMALLKAGADVNGTMQPKKPSGKGPRPGTVPLFMAVENGHFELALALVDRGADPNDQRCGFAPLHAVSWVRKPNRGDGDDGDPAPAGSGKVGSLEFVRELVRRGADANARLRSGKSGRGHLSRAGATPLMMAAITDDVPLMELLVSLGANPAMTNLDGATPLMAAAGLGTQAPTEEAGTEEEAIQAVELLLKLGADVNARDQNGETAMHGAAYKNLPRVVELLAKRGADPDVWNQTNRWGWTPLRIAEGHRPGNFKPSPETVAAVQRALMVHR